MHAVGTKMFDLLLPRKRRFLKGPSHSGPFSATYRPKIKDPPSVHILADRGRAGAIGTDICADSQQINNRSFDLSLFVNGWST